MDRPSLVNPPPVRIKPNIQFSQMIEYIKLLDRMEQTTEVIAAKNKALLVMDQFMVVQIDCDVPHSYQEEIKPRKHKGWFK